MLDYHPGNSQPEKAQVAIDQVVCSAELSVVWMEYILSYEFPMGSRPTILSDGLTWLPFDRGGATHVTSNTQGFGVIQTCIHIQLCYLLLYDAGLWHGGKKSWPRKILYTFDEIMNEESQVHRHTVSKSALLPLQLPQIYFCALAKPYLSIVASAPQWIQPSTPSTSSED